MSQFELFTIDSPCVGICTLNKKGYCIGCLRNRKERQSWHTLNEDEKYKILTLINKRMRRLQDDAIKNDKVSQIGLLDWFSLIYQMNDLVSCSDFQKLNLKSQIAIGCDFT